VEMLGSAVGRRMAAAAAALVSGGVGAAAVATPAAAAGPPGPDPRNTHYQAYVKQALSGVLKHGMPSKDNIKYRDGHCLAYDRATRNPRWVRQQNSAALSLQAAQPVLSVVPSHLKHARNCCRLESISPRLSLR
jgi:hypothetical protein